MEYAMGTLITGERSLKSLVGVTTHELAHSWFQHVLATNESKHPWMDEGFTTYISTLCNDKILGVKRKILSIDPIKVTMRWWSQAKNNPLLLTLTGTRTMLPTASDLTVKALFS